MKNETKLTAKEIEFLENLDRVPKGKSFGNLKAKSYLGKSQTLGFLNLLKEEEKAKYIGTMQYVNEGGKDFWYLYAMDGETYRIPEPADGIDEFFDIEFKRNEL